MVSISNLRSLRDLTEESAGNPHDDIILERIKDLAERSLPEGWKHWKVSVLNKIEILGDELDSQLLNKIRFALPTVGVAQAFNPNLTSLSEKHYREMKLRMLDWPFCVGLIVRPSSLAARIRGSAAQNEIVLAAIREMQPDMLSREGASSRLSEKSSENETRVAEPSKNKKHKESRLDKLERSNAELKTMLETIMNRLEPAPNTPVEFSDHEESDDMADAESDQEERSSWAAPQLHEEEMEIDFCPRTTEQEPAVPAPKPHIKSQGKECQRLGLASYNKIRYADVQKKLQASPVFSALRINPQLLHHSQVPNLQEQASKTDGTLGTILHGMLLQREAFSEGVKDIITKCPAVKPLIQEKLLQGEFRQISDDLLQYTCGKRAETIEQRRKMFKPRSDYAASLLENIPPSESHLFDESLFDEFFRQHGRWFRFTPNRTSAATSSTIYKRNPGIGSRLGTTKGKGISKTYSSGSRQSLEIHKRRNQLHRGNKSYDRSGSSSRSKRQ